MKILVSQYIVSSFHTIHLKNLPAIQETGIWILGREDTPGKEIATHFRIPAWEIPWTEKSGRLQSMGLQESNTTQLKHHHHHKPSKSDIAPKQWGQKSSLTLLKYVKVEVTEYDFRNIILATEGMRDKGNTELSVQRLLLLMWEMSAVERQLMQWLPSRFPDP